MWLESSGKAGAKSVTADRLITNHLSHLSRSRKLQEPISKTREPQKKNYSRHIWHGCASIENNRRERELRNSAAIRWSSQSHLEKERKYQLLCPNIVRETKRKSTRGTRATEPRHAARREGIFLSTPRPTFPFSLKTPLRALLSHRTAEKQTSSKRMHAIPVYRREPLECHLTATTEPRSPHPFFFCCPRNVKPSYFCASNTTNRESLRPVRVLYTRRGASNLPLPELPVLVNVSNNVRSNFYSK